MKSLIDLVFPRLCISCQQETQIKNEYFCISCLQKLSFTDQFSVKDNAFMRRFYGRIELKESAALFWYSKGDKVQKMIYSIKYNHEKYIGRAIGEVMAEKILSTGAFSDIDMVIPVPLHPKKKHKRGFNQSELIGKSLADKLNLRFSSEVLIKLKNTESQTHKSRLERLKDIENGFGLKKINLIVNKNILLVDDVLTTGATLEACAKQLLIGGVSSISMVTIAMGRLD